MLYDSLQLDITEKYFLSQIYTPDLPLEQKPAFVALKSSDNDPIESSWDNLRDFNGRDLKAAILLAKDADSISYGLIISTMQHCIKHKLLRLTFAWRQNLLDFPSFA